MHPGPEGTAVLQSFNAKGDLTSISKEKIAANDGYLIFFTDWNAWIIETFPPLEFQRLSFELFNELCKNFPFGIVASPGSYARELFVLFQATEILVRKWDGKVSIFQVEHEFWICRIRICRTSIR